MSVDQTRPAGLGKERASYIFKWWEGPQPILVAALKWELVISALKAASITSIVLALGITLLGTYLFTNSGTARPEEPGCTLLQSPLAGRQFTCEAKNHCPLDWIPSLAAVVTLVDVFFAALFGGLLVLSSSNMHSRRHLKGSRQLPEPDTLVQSSSSTSSQEFRSSFSSSEVRTLQTSRVIRKTTTMVQGGDQHTVTTNVVSPGRTTTTQHVIKQESSSVGRTDRTDKTQKVQSPIKSLTSRKVPATTTPGNKRITTKTVEKIQKKQKISDIIGQTDETISARDALLNWAQHTTDLYPGVTVIDFTSSWRDGLAFNAIIHRNRPDLIDWRSMRANSPHENLELAFSIMEREYGVTRLLDPEDVDTLEPDEKSLITYVSSLYDVFPEPPAYHPFADNDKLRKLEEYTELASILHLWMRETIMMFQDRTFPNTLVEMKAYLAECNRFRVEDIPQRLHDKQKLSSLYKDLQKLFRETGSVEIESELEIDTIERNWNRLMIAHQERDQAVHDEINRLEKLQRLAEKLHREAKQCDGKLDDIDKRIAEEEKRVQRLHPTDAIYICDQIEAELKLVEENIQVMFQDVDTLRDGRYHQTHELYKRVQNIQQRWLNIRLNFTSRLLTPLSSRTYKTEERQVTKQRQIVSERRLVETNDAFKVLQECLDWVNGKLKLLYAAEYGSDLSSVKSLLENHQLEHQSIDQFHVNIDQCATKKHQFQGDEQELYYRLFSKLEKGYTELVVMSNKRLTDLETLLDFIQSATNELMWMNKKEEIEVTRDWSSKTLDIVEIEQYQETLTSDLEKREIQFNAVTDRGQSLQLQKHPATECIEAYLAAMQSQWSWLLQLTICLEEHLKHSSAYHQFFTESRECEQWLGRIEDRLNTTFSRKTFPIDEGERLLMQMLELREDMMHYKNIVFSLVDRSKEIVPLKQRRQHLSKPLQVIAICSYKQLNMTVSANEHCWLHDNSQKIKWKVINSAGTEGMVPGVCFVIPPPNAEAVDLAQSLNKKFDNVLTLWSKKHHKLRQNMIFSTVRVIKSWDFTTFRSMEPAQRESIQRALKEDGQKLVDEGDTNDPDLKRLQDEINICNKLFQDFVKRLKGDEVDRTLGSRFTDLISSLQNSLNEKEKILQNRSQEPIPRDLDTLDTQVMDHKEFETDLKSLEPQIEEMKDQFQSMAKKSPVLQNRHDTVIEIWERTWTVSHLYIERLKSVEIILNVLDEATSVVTQMEIQLVKYENLSADMTTLSKTHEQLMKLQGQIQQGQNVIDQLNNDLTNVQRLTECTRPKQLKHPDIKKLEDDVKKITKRWDNGCSQVVERLRSCEAASELVRTYRTKLDKDEQPWMNQMFTRIKKLKPVKSMTPQQAEKEVQNIVEFYNSVSQRKSSIEHTNTLGGRYVREAKIYDLRLKHYSESLEEVHPSLDASIPKKAKVVVGADVISQELDVLNKQYTDVVDKILQYLNELREYLSGQKDYKTAVEEKYKLSGDNILKLLRWIEEVEGRLADLDQVHENITELQKQIARARDIKDDLDDHQRPVATCLDKVRQIVQQGADVLSKEEIEQLQKDSNELKKRYDKICEESEKLLRRLSSSQEELDKFNVELQTFKKWLIEAEQKLHEQEKDLGDVKNLKENSETFKTFMNDVIAHQADLRFITMIAQKFIDESKDYLKILNNFRTNLPRRRAHVEPKESEVKTEVSEVSTTYHNLLNRVNRLSEKFSRVIEKERYYVECLEKATVWLQDVRRSSFKLLDEPIAAEPRAIHDQLNRIKTISLDIVGQSRLIENTKQSGKFLIEFLEGTEVSFTEIQIIEETLQTLEDDYYTLSNDISEKCNELQTALVQSQDIQDGLDHLLKWLDETENTFRTQNKAISLIRERLDEQIREHKVLQTDIDSQKPSISAVTNLAKDLTDSSNQRLAKKVESKMKDINTRFEKLCEKSRKRGELLDEVVVMVKTFEVMIVRFEEWIQVITETVESREIIQLSTEEYISRIEEAINQRTAKKDDFDEIVKTGKNLVSKRDVTDTTPTKDKVKSLEQQWKDLGDSLTEKQRAGKTRAQQQFAYETLRAKVLEWLANIENRVEELNVVAIDQNVLQQQAAETKLLIKEHTDYAPTVDKVNDLGNSYDAILHGEQGDSPRRRAGSPTKKVASSPSVAPSSPTKKSPSSEYTETRRSPDVQSPTHAKFIQSPLSTVSSGFSSQRSSADNLRGVEDLSPVQQQLSEINNRYSLLGVKLSDRHQEIETLTEEVKRHLETIRILLTFIKAKEKQLPQEALPENKEQAEKQLLLLKTIQEEVQEKQPDMDRVKAQTQDLLRKKPNVLGSDNLRNQINELVSRWSELIEVTKQQLDLLQGFKDFQDTHDIVTNWLIQKDKMLQVLGPIASEPRMVTSQMQQVQVMREEFRCQQSLLNRLDSSGQAVIDSLGPASPASTKVQDQMDTIHRTWEDLLRRLADREKSLDAACGVTKEFHDTLNRLHVCLQDIGDNFDQLSESSYDIVQQLNTLNDLEGQLESQRPHLAGAESVCEELCEILSDTTSKTEIKTKFITLQKQFFNLTKKIDNRKAELESSQKEDQEFYSSCENIKIWLDKMQDNLSKTLNISADRDILTEQLKDFQPLYRDVLDKEHEVHILLSKGNDVVNKITNKTEALQLKNKLDTIKIQWDTIRKDAHDRQNRLQRCADTSRRFHSALAEFIPWLEECERKLDSLQPISFQRTELDKQVKDIQAFKNELSRHSQEFDNICNFGEVLLDQTDVDQQDVQQQLNELKEHWDRLNQGVLERAQAMDNISRLLITYYDTTRDVQHTLQRLEDKMTSLEGLSDVVLLDRLKVLLEEANDLHHQFDQVRDSANQLLSNASPDSDIDHISEEVTTLEDRHKHLIKTLEDRCAQLEFATNVLLDFMNKEKKVHQDLRSVEEELDNMAPVARVITTVQTQIVGIKDYMGLLEKVNDDIEDVCQQGENLIHQGYVTDIIACREKLENIRQQFSRTEEQAKVRYTILESSLAQLERFYEDYSDTMTELDKAIKEEKNFKIISGEVETIRSLQEEFKIFRRTHIEPLSKQITDVNKLGQGLVQSAMPGVDTTKLEQDMETLNEKWNNLKERLNDRERLLDLTLLQSGKFQEALEGVQKWLQDTEEMISNQRAPSADYKVVKAQLQEQKFLRKLLLDRQNSMTSLSDMGTEIMQNLELTEQKQITVQLNYLTERFNILITEARERMEVLEKTIPVAQDFQDKIGPLLVWLERVEKRLVIMTTIPIDQDKIRKQITEHKELHEDIINQKTLFDELNDVGETLVTLVSEEEAYTIREKFQDTNYRYVKVREDSESIGRMLIQALEGMGSFLINCEKLLTWLQEVDNKLSRYQILSVYVDKLQEQIDELTVLRSEIESHQWEVESLLTAAQEIMRHASGDDAVQMKDKADTIQSKFNEVSQRCNERQKQALEVLPLTQNFHSSHEQLVFWMDETERILKTLESLSLSTQETTITQLEKEIHEYRPLVESVSSLGPRLCQISPGEGSHLLETLVTRDNRRYDAICEQVQRKAERIQLSKQKNSEVMADIDELLEWFRGTQQKVKDAEPLYPDPDTLTGLVKEQKVVNEDVSGQKSRVRDILATAKKLMREMSTEDLSLIREKADELKDLSSCVSTMCIDRMSALEQALPLAEHFFETHIDLIQWLDEAEAEAELLETPTLNVPQIKRQQDKTQELLQSLNEHKPLVDKLNKTGSALLKLCGDEEGSKVQEIMDSDNSRYNSLRGLIRNRQNTLEEALQATSQFSDKLDGMLQALSTTVDQLGNAEPISAHPERIVEQITDNKNVLEDLAKRSTALEAVKRAADDVITKAGKDQPAVEDIRQKLDRLNDLWDNIQKSTKNRGRSLEDALTVAEKFWDELNAVMKALKELQENLNAQDPPAIEPSAIQEQQEALQEIKQEIDQTRPEVDQCRQVGQDLMQLCGEPDKPEVKKHIEDLDSAWENVTTLYAKREQNLVDAMEKAMSFHFTLQNLLEFLDNAEEQFTNLGPVGSDIDAVKSQIAQLKEFKTEVDPHMVEIEALNRQAQELVERTSPDQALAIREPLAEINRRWDNLLRGIVERQQELENALLKLGQFQHALDELLSWITRTERTLTDLKPVAGDPQVIEVELAKHKVLVNDIQAHQSSIDTINRVGHQLVDTDHGSEDANVTQKKMNDLNIRWQQLQDKAIERQKELEAALKEAVAFNQEIQDLLLWLSDVDSQLATSKPVGGLPETAKEQLNRFMELYNELDLNRHKVETVLQQGQDYLKRTNEDTTTNLQHNLKILKQRWDSVLNKANDRKIKLEIALREATQFHEALQEFVDWLTNAEKYLTSMKPVSRVMETVMEQIKDHKSFQKDLGSHREVMLNLDKKGTHLKYFSQKQDVILIKNLLISVQHRWERVVSKAAERTRMLDHGYKEAKEFYDAWSELISWLDEAKATLDSLTHIGKDPDKIKQLLNKHKEFQRALGAKQSKYDTTMKIGRILKDRCPKSDLPGLQEMIDELKNKWNAVCNKSVNRQRELEEALLYSGQFKDAVVALFDWLDRAKGVLAIEQPIQGDLDTVTSLVDQHKTFQNELHNRANNLDSVRRTAGGLLQTATPEEMQHIHSQVNHLDEKWEELIKLSNEKQQRLDEALQKAELLHKSVHILLEWLSDAEIKLRFTGPLPDDEETTRQQIIEHQNFLDQLKEQEDNKDKTLVLAQEILQHCHPDGITIIRHWITIIQSRWEEIFVWARQRDQKLQDHLRSLRDITDLLDELMKWLLGAEATLTALEAEPLSDDVPVLEQLITDHQDFMADMTKRQPEIDQITKAFSSKRQPPKQSYHPPHRVKGGRHEDRRPSRGVGATGPKTSTPSKPYSDPEIKNPRARDLLDKWRNVWLLAMERQRRLQDKLNYLRELERIKNFNFDDWRRRFLGWMNNKKSRIMDLFRKIDKNNDGRVTRAEFIDGILKSKFPTSRLEMERVAEIFDVNGDGFIDNKEYIDTLRPDREGRPKTDAEKIQDEVQRQVAKCLCVHKFKVYQVGEGKYRFGDSQKLRLVRILRSTVMVHVGGGWVALDEFLVKNDPCRAKGRTNVELREQFTLAEGVSQSMSPFRPKPSSNASQSSHSGSSFGRSGSIPSTGPITKVREKSERSTPLQQRRTSGTADTSSESGPSFSETDSFGARSGRPWLTPTTHRGSPSGTKTSSRPTSRNGSHPSSRPSSKPPSRAGSDLSTDSVEAYRSARRTPVGNTKIPASTGRQRTPSGSSQTSATKSASSTPGTRIPTVRKTSSGGRADGIKGKEKWK
ncbi:microtubule-actin cross-linking factor 1-like isoform X9 [Tachypleus tridentatus]|uniref:microtubule-actin cross-linking factor 1-like isoform X9 n=1 Tax=Tachypleus tridentatus TaxID=6853 RepID=UPI003FD0DC77